MRVAIVGAGAVGGVLGSMLARAGNEVSFVAQGDSLEQIRKVGFHVASPGGSFDTGPLKADPQPANIGQVDLVLVCVKSWQVEGVAPSLKALLGPRTIVVPTENGVEAAIQLAAALGDEFVIGGLCHVIATREAPGHVKYVGPVPSLTIGERAGNSQDNQVTPRIESLAAALRAAGITVSAASNIEIALWNKLLFVEPWGSVGAYWRATVEVLRATPEQRAMLEASMREVQAVAAALGVPVPDSAIEQSLARIDALPAGATASMHRDLLEGRPNELNEQTGAVVRLGAKSKVPTPIHQQVFDKLSALTNK